MGYVSIRNVQKTFGGLTVLHGISVDIQDGEFIALVGPSGCGKSTLLRMIAGLEEISAGEIHVGDRVINDLAPKDRDIAMVFQSYALYPHMTVAQNMGFSLKLSGKSKDEIQAATRGAAEILGLENHLDRYPRELSGGQRQRVAMGRAIVRNPAVFLFDEPLSNLDAQLRVQMRTELKTLHQKLRTTTVYVTHDQIEAMTLADRVVVMHDGRVEQVGKPLDLYDRPANTFVAGFIGSPAMNMLAGTVVGETVDLAGATLPLPRASTAGLDGKRVIVGIRPEHMTLQSDGFRAEVLAVEPTGSEVQITMRFGGAIIVGLFRERVGVSPGMSLGISVAAENLHIFDEATGDRIPRELA